jgi:DNA-binding NarL/FixJ family response regulator
MQLFRVQIPLPSLMENEPMLKLVIDKRLLPYSIGWEAPVGEDIPKLSKPALAGWLVSLKVVVLDLEMPYHGLTALEEIRERELPVRVVVLTASGDGSSIQSALELRAEGFALKTESPVQLIEAIRQVAQGRIIFPAAAQRWFMNQPKQETTRPRSDLSAREWQVIECTARGMTNPEIAESLGVSANTVRFHPKSIFGKMQVSNRTEAAAWYFANKE